MKITDIKLHVTPMASNWLTEKIISHPLSPYPEYFERRSSWYQTQTAGVVEVVLEDGTVGHGFVGGSKASACAVMLEEQVKHLLLGRDVFQTELVSDLVYRATVMYGQGGAAACLASGIDIAMWDAKGKLLGKPVVDLLGGRTTESMRAYLTSFDAAALDKFGVRDVKIAVPYGPSHGEAGMRANEAAVAATRELIGPDGFIALDCYMSWDVPYTIAMAKRLQHLGVAWIEEPVMPEDIEGYARIKDKVDIMITGGEHCYTLDHFRRLIADGGVDIIQPDIYRAGGPTVLKQIAALAKAHGRKLVCHGVGMPTYHFLASLTPDVTPFVEYLDIYSGSEHGWVLDGDPAPAGGRLRIDDAPGFGYRLNERVFQEGLPVSPIW